MYVGMEARVDTYGTLPGRSALAGSMRSTTSQKDGFIWIYMDSYALRCTYLVIDQVGDA